MPRKWFRWTHVIKATVFFLLLSYSGLLFLKSFSVSVVSLSLMVRKFIFWAFLTILTCRFLRIPNTYPVIRHLVMDSGLQWMKFKRWLFSKTRLRTNHSWQTITFFHLKNHPSLSDMMKGNKLRLHQWPAWFKFPESWKGLKETFSVKI